MDRLQCAAVLTSLIDKLREHGSWAGETHIQKASYLLQEMLGVPMGFQFVLYKYGPFSFELRDELAALREDDILYLEIKKPEYGPSYATEDRANYIQELRPITMQKYRNKINFISNKLGPKGVNELEKISTAFYVTQKFPEKSVQDRAVALTNFKPHIPTNEAISAVNELDDIAQEATGFLN